MRILHLTDFHFRGGKEFEFDQSRLVSAVCEKLSSEPPIDILLFTGDLVNKGNNPDDFETARKALLDEVQRVTKIDSSRIFICSGNHDVHRAQEMSSINLKFENLSSNEELDKFISNEKDRVKRQRVNF